MAMIPLPHKVTVENPGSIGNNGRPSYSAPVEYRARVSMGYRMVRNKDGAEVVASSTILFDKYADIRVDAKLTYTDEIGRVHRMVALTSAPKIGLGKTAILTEVTAV